MPASFFDAAAKNEVLQIVFFTMLFAIALAQVAGPAEGEPCSSSSSRSPR